jgi:hypothetical protein
VPVFRQLQLLFPFIKKWCVKVKKIDPGLLFTDSHRFGYREAENWEKREVEGEKEWGNT